MIGAALCTLAFGVAHAGTATGALRPPHRLLHCKHGPPCGHTCIAKGKICYVHDNGTVGRVRGGFDQQLR
jgi:hypothetical protein